MNVSDLRHRIISSLVIVFLYLHVQHILRQYVALSKATEDVIVSMVSSSGGLGSYKLLKPLAKSVIWFVTHYINQSLVYIKSL